MATSAAAVGSERMTEEQEARLGKARGGETVTGAAAAGDDSIATNTKRCGLAQRNVFWDPARTVNVFELRPWFGVSGKPARRQSRVKMVPVSSLPLSSLLLTSGQQNYCTPGNDGKRKERVSAVFAADTDVTKSGQTSSLHQNLDHYEGSDMCSTGVSQKPDGKVLL